MDLLNGLKNNNELAFQQIFIDYREKVFNYFIKKTGSVTDAEDLLQNTFLKLWRYRSSLNECYLLDQHLFNIARTVFIDYTRSKNKLRKIEALVKREVTAAKEEIKNELDKERLEQILKEMPEERRKAFLMHKVEGYTYKEIADELSLNTKTVDNHISRALKQIRKAFAMLFSF